MAGIAVKADLAFHGFRLRVDETFPARGLTAVFGPSGCGKSTLLRIIAGLENGAVGHVSFGDETWQDEARFMAPHKRGVGYVFQDARLFAHLNVAGNLRYAQKRAHRAGRSPDAARIMDALGLEGMLERRPAGLSGGERQRVAIGRALMSAPRLLLLDEPLSALDDSRKDAILPFIEQVRDRMNVPMIYVSHSVSEVARLADTIAVMNEGAIVRSGPATEVLADPETLPGMGVREAGAILTARIISQHEDGLTELSVAGGKLFLPGVAAAAGQQLRVRISAQDVIIAKERPENISALNILKATVAKVHFGEGPGAAVQLDLGGECLLARVTRRSAHALGLEPGMACYAIVKSVAVARGDVGQTEST